MADQISQKTTTIQIKILEEKSQKSAKGTAELLTWDRSMAMKKSMNGLWIAWGLAFLTIPIPLVHFVSVPILLLAGPIIAFGVYKLHINSVDVVSGGGPCPICETPIVLDKKTAEWPTFNICPQCLTSLYIFDDRL